MSQRVRTLHRALVPDVSLPAHSPQGTIPTELGTLTDLSIMDLEQNTLTVRSPPPPRAHPLRAHPLRAHPRECEHSTRTHHPYPTIHTITKGTIPSFATLSLAFALRVRETRRSVKLP